jgi:MFS family permease
MISGLSAMLLWGEAKTLMATIVFAFIYGSTSGGYGALRSRYSKTVVGNPDRKEQIVMVYGIFTAMRGIGNLVGGFAGQHLVDERVKVQLLEYGLNKFTSVILFVGLGMMAAGVLGATQYAVQAFREAKQAAKARTHRSWTKEIDIRSV